jgi:hypothetical protein
LLQAISSGFSIRTASLDHSTCASNKPAGTGDSGHDHPLRPQNPQCPADGFDLT